MSELLYAHEIVTSAITDSTEKIASRRAVVYKTLIDPAVARITAEKDKHKLFNKFLFKLTSPAEIEFVSTEKYYEPFMTISGNYLIDYFRKCSYTIRIDHRVTEVILLNKSFTPKQTSNLTANEHTITLEGEERIVKNVNAFLILNANGQELKSKDFPSAPSEENAQQLIDSNRMREVQPEIDIETLRSKIAQRPRDTTRIITEQFEVDQRSLIYRPMFKVTYKCAKLGKEAFIIVDGTTSKIVKQNENFLIAATRNVFNEFKHAFYF